MRCYLSFASLVAIAAAAANVSAQVVGNPIAGRPAAPPQLEPLTAAGDTVVHALRLDGASLAVLRENGLVHRSEHGNLGAGSVIPIASASKWLTVATIMALVDEGVLDLDLPVARYVEELRRDDKDDLTLRQCLSCTAGFAARLGGRMRGWGTDKFAEAVADAPLRFEPGSSFRYGGVTFQVAAVAAERATGKSWHELFKTRIAEPLGLQATAFGGLYPIAGDPGTHALPWVAGGAVSSLADYEKFVQCLLAGGRFGGKQVLSEDSVDTMFTDQVNSYVEVHPVGVEAEDVRYGLGTWIFPLDDDATRVADPGAFGFTPWIDRDLGIGGVFAVRDRVRRVFGKLLAVMAVVREVAESPLVAGTEETITLRHDGRDRRYHLHLPAAVVAPEAASGAAQKPQQSKRLPLVVVLHGGGGNGEHVARTSQFAELADREGFVVAFPDGTGRLRGKLLTWNDGVLPVYAKDQKIDDVGFLREVVRDVAKRAPIDPARIFAVGHSNGGMMCHRLAREAADLFAGIAVVGGAMNFTAEDSRLPIGVCLVHGTDDEHVRYDGGRPERALGRAGRREDASVQDAIDYYVARNGLLARPDRKENADSGVRIDTFDRVAGAGEDDDKLTDTPVRVITLQGGGHAWPGSPVEPGRLLRDRPFDFEATEAIWSFFQRVQRPRVAAVPR